MSNDTTTDAMTTMFPEGAPEWAQRLVHNPDVLSSLVFEPDYFIPVNVQAAVLSLINAPIVGGHKIPSMYEDMIARGEILGANPPVVEPEFTFPNVVPAQPVTAEQQATIEAIAAGADTVVTPGDYGTWR